MSTAPIHADAGAPEAGESSMFDSLARLVPDKSQAAYDRVLAHTRTLSPDDEMLRILEAMGILALLTRPTPKDIADERERIQTMLDGHLQFSDEAQEEIKSAITSAIADEGSSMRAGSIRLGLSISGMGWPKC